MIGGTSPPCKGGCGRRPSCSRTSISAPARRRGKWSAQQLQIVGDFHARPAVPRPDDDRERAEDGVDRTPLEAELAEV